MIVVRVMVVRARRGTVKDMVNSICTSTYRIVVCEMHGCDILSYFYIDIYAYIILLCYHMRSRLQKYEFI